MWGKLKTPAAKATALLLFLQLALPSPCTLSLPQARMLALGSICHAPIDDDGHRPPQQPVGEISCHCLACQAGVAMALPPSAVGIISRVFATTTLARSLPNDAPRDITRQAYASRAPPMPH
jgi:hypothetical protein